LKCIEVHLEVYFISYTLYIIMAFSRLNFIKNAKQNCNSFNGRGYIEIAGPTGPTGFSSEIIGNGSKGDTGSTGYTGMTGSKGIDGTSTNGSYRFHRIYWNDRFNGYTGSKGDIGEKGIDGTSTNGSKGDTGSTGYIQ
jgi:hypothetical protein